MRGTEFCYSKPFFFFFALLPSNNLENQNLGKMKEPPGDVIILHMCTKNQDHMMYAS